MAPRSSGDSCSLRAACLPPARSGPLAQAALLTQLALELPQARYVRTGNAQKNTAMVRVNAELGFVVISEDQWWELRLEQLRAALGRRA